MLEIETNNYTAYPTGQKQKAVISKLLESKTNKSIHL